ncbi:MAG: M20/M25/M40 family metallo-hydrolase [Pseudomonadota bacterium]
MPTQALAAHITQDTTLPISTRFTLLLLVITFPAAADEIPGDVARKAATIRDQAMAGTVAYDLVESLTMEVGHRSSGSPGDAKAVAWALENLEALGFQNVRAESVEVAHWERGELDVRVTAPNEHKLVALSLGGSPGTRGNRLSANVVRVESLNELRALSARDLRGNIAYIDHRVERHKTGRGYGPASRIRSCAHYIAAERGAVATVIRSAGTSTHRFAHTGGMLNNKRPATIPGIALANADADLLTYQIESGERVQLSIQSTATNLPRTTSANVIGEVPGRGPLADEIVLLVGHLDSWDVGTGAYDDGAGVAIVTAAAKLILDSGEAPRRTIRVVLFANEEFGLDGAEQYTQRYARSIDKHIVGMEADFGAGRVWRFSSNVSEDALDLVDEIHALLEPIGLERGNNRASGGADLTYLRKAGMPVLGMSQDGTYYFDYHHTEDDTLDKIDINDLNQNVASYVTAAYVAANIERDFGRIPVNPAPFRGCSAAED